MRDTRRRSPPAHQRMGQGTGSRCRVGVMGQGMGSRCRVGVTGQGMGSRCRGGRHGTGDGFEVPRWAYRATMKNRSAGSPATKTASPRLSVLSCLRETIRMSSQVKPSQVKSSQAKSSQAKPSQAKSSQAKPSQVTCLRETIRMKPSSLVRSDSSAKRRACGHGRVPLGCEGGVPSGAQRLLGEATRLWTWSGPIGV
jgi:hypothetical protein